MGLSAFISVHRRLMDCPPVLRQPEVRHFSLNGEVPWRRRREAEVDGIRPAFVRTRWSECAAVLRFRNWLMNWMSAEGCCTCGGERRMACLRIGRQPAAAWSSPTSNRRKSCNWKPRWRAWKGSWGGGWGVGHEGIVEQREGGSKLWAIWGERKCSDRE